MFWSFTKVEKYLSFPPLLKKSSPGEIIYLYLPMLETTVNSVLVLEEGQKHFPVYNVSKVMLNAETIYACLEPLALALIETIKKLKHYFSLTLW